MAQTKVPTHWAEDALLGAKWESRPELGPDAVTLTATIDGVKYTSNLEGAANDGSFEKPLRMLDLKAFTDMIAFGALAKARLEVVYVVDSLGNEISFGFHSTQS